MRRAGAAFLLGIAIFPVLRIDAQSPPAGEPDHEQLLNGLTILFWQRPGDQNVMLKLRINSGAAFDLAGKAGMMSLLGDALFPDPSAREYVTEQLGGKLDVTTTMDTTEITISGKTGEFERMVELLRNGLLSTQLSAENVTRLREERLKQLSQNPASASVIADRAVAQRLFGGFPYAHTSEGSIETIPKIERGDLMLARERFLNADNAVLAVVGGIEKARAMRALRQLLGPWNKSDRTIPATFRQPDPSDPRVLVVNQANGTTAEIRLAVRGLSRNDRDADLATFLLPRIVRDRWQSTSPDLSSVSVRHEPHTLPGIFVMSATTPVTSAAKGLATARQLIMAVAQAGPTSAELERARNEALTEITRRLSQTESIAAAWLDTITFNTGAPNTLENSIRAATPADIRRVAARLFKDTPVATVAVGNSQQLKASFSDPIELREAPAGANASSTSKEPTKKP